MLFWANICDVGGEVYRSGPEMVLGVGEPVRLPLTCDIRTRSTSCGSSRFLFTDRVNASIGLL